MAFPTTAHKGWYKQQFVQQMNSSAANLDSSATSGMRFALFLDAFDGASVTGGGYDTHTSFGSAPYTSNQVTGTSGYVQDGWACSGVQWAVSGANTLALIVGNVGSAASSILNARGGVLYHNSTATKLPCITSWFGGANYTSSNGIFSVSWTNGIAFQIV